HVNTGGTGLKVHHIWGLVARATANGKLGSTAKVSPYNDYNPKEDWHVICIYNEDFTDKEVYNLENLIRNIGIKCSLAHKPDMYAYLGIYRNNKWGLRPTIYQTVYDLMKGAT
ncbi:putative phosphothreonine lyase domain-containg protein, partial [Acinetobacter baumannii]|uniref:putative phosphothreonine lyase domain-containing protein n=1 Tax=Acinetobacter baumannii TaxID=470 RepID=UPI00117872C7